MCTCTSQQAQLTYGNTQCAHCRIAQILDVGFQHTDVQVPQHPYRYIPPYASDARFDMFWNTVLTQLKIHKILIIFHYFGPWSFSPAGSTRTTPTTLTFSRHGSWITETISHYWSIIVSNIYTKNPPCHYAQMTFQGTLQICYIVRLKFIYHFYNVDSQLKPFND